MGAGRGPAPGPRLEDRRGRMDHPPRAVGHRRDPASLPPPVTGHGVVAPWGGHPGGRRTRAADRAPTDLLRERPRRPDDPVRAWRGRVVLPGKERAHLALLRRRGRMAPGPCPT